jgi:hypothetical protein
MAKTAKKPAHKEVEPTLDDRLCDPKFIRFVRNTALMQATRDESIPTGQATAIVHDLDEDDIAEAARLAFAECQPAQPAEGEEQEQEEVDSQPQPMRAVGGIGSSIFDFIHNIDPAIKAKIIEILFKFIGVK